MAVRFSGKTQNSPLWQTPPNLCDGFRLRFVARILGIELYGTGYILGKIFAIGKIDKEELVEKVKEMRDGGWYVSAEDYLKIIDYLKNLKIF